MSGLSSVRRVAFILSTSVFAHAALADSMRSPWDGLIEQSTRVEIVQGLCNSLKRSYAGWELKKKIQISEGYSLAVPAKDEPVADGDAICAAAVAHEGKISDPRGRERLTIAKANLAFRDRVQLLGAGFKDSHLSLFPIQTRTEIQLGISFREIEGKFYVSHVAGFLQSFLAMSGQKVPAVGDEVVSYNGQGLSEARDALLPMISASSERAAKTRSLEALTYRYFSYPSSGRVTLKWTTAAGAQSAEFPWIYGLRTRNSGSPVQEDDAVYLKQIGAVENAAAFVRQLTDGSRAVNQSEELDDDEIVQSMSGNLDSTEVLFDFNGRVSALSGIYRGKYLVIQIRNFADWKVAMTIPAPAKKPEKILTVGDYLGKWLSAAEKYKAPIILDLRANSGGSMSNAVDLVAYLTADGASAMPVVEAFPITYGNRFSIFQEFSPETRMQKRAEVSSNYEKGFAEDFSCLLQAEAEQKYFISPLYRRERIGSKGVFESSPKILVWTTEECVSACEVAAMMLSSRPGINLMGTPMNGTGMSMASGSYQLKVQAAGEPNNLFTSSSLPNGYFGLPVDSLNAQGVDGSGTLESRIAKISENRPLKPGIAYAEKLEDLTSNGIGWLKASEKALAAPVSPASSLFIRP